VADIGVFEQSLTTDLLNHLVFVQKVFMKVSYHIFNININYLYCYLHIKISYIIRKLMKLSKKFMEAKSQYLYG